MGNLLLSIVAIAATGWGQASNPAGYVASFDGGITLIPVSGAKRTLKPKDKEHAIRLYPGDKLTLDAKDSALSLVVYGRRMRLNGTTTFTVPMEDPRSGQLASRAAMAGRGAGSSDTAPYEKLAILANQTLGQSPVGNLIPAPDGTLPLVWVAANPKDKVRITLALEDGTKVQTDWLKADENSVAGYPFGVIRSAELGKFLTEQSSPDFALSATLSIENDKGESNTTYWEIPKKAFIEAALDSFGKFDLGDFDGFDQAVAFCEGNDGERRGLPTYPMLRASLVVDRWKAGPAEWMRLSMLHLLVLEYRFDGLEAKLKKQLQEKDGGVSPSG